MPLDGKEKLIKTYKNKRKEISSTKEIIYSDWVDIFDTGLKKIQSLNKQEIYLTRVWVCKTVPL